MKKVNLLAIIAIILVVVVAVVLLFCFGNRSESDNKGDLLKCSTVSDVEDYIRRNEIKRYELNDDACAIDGISVFGANSIVEISFQDKAVSRINVDYTLFQDSFEGLSEEERESFDITQYQFSQENKERIDKAFNEIKISFEQYVDGSVDHYDLIPTQEGVSIEENEDLFYQGLLIKEYSLRDRNNVLWLLRYQAAYGMAHATLIKIVDETGYEGFVPIVDLTKA